MRFLLDEGNTALFVSSAAILFWMVQYSLTAPWWRHFMGITLIGFALCLLLIYVPALLALAWPAEFAHFATTTWYQDLAVGIVNATALFMITRIAVWEYVRRHRDKYQLPSNLVAEIKRLKAENAELRARLESELWFPVPQFPALMRVLDMPFGGMLTFPVGLVKSAHFELSPGEGILADPPAAGFVAVDMPPVEYENADDTPGADEHPWEH